MGREERQNRTEETLIKTQEGKFVRERGKKDS